MRRRRASSTAGYLDGGEGRANGGGDRPRGEEGASAEVRGGGKSEHATGTRAVLVGGYYIVMCWKAGRWDVLVPNTGKVMVVEMVASPGGCFDLI